ncbi:M-phase phosphoprotein 6 [Trichoplusia ni]|uniref:M-phase phosphoprotein 6 n=1 Tax=Trichoplusia ni TaxID=7111 RepID=A0A7E5WBI9_TRINI|nr:M-phase phosphoprotein 6 [Trichoplusia ni]
MAGKTKKIELPKSVLEMKFMKKTRERIEKELQNTQDHGRLYSDIITNEMRSASGNFISESSFIFCETMLDGRLSFKGMNPEIERLMEMEKAEAEKPSGEMVKDVSDDILAKKMAKLNKMKRPSASPVVSELSKIKRKK